MLELCPLASLLTAPRGEQTIAWDGERALPWSHFLQRVADWRGVLDLAPGTQIALYHGDALEFAAALYAAWLAELEVVVASDTVVASVDALRPLVQALVGEFGEHTQVATPAVSARALPPTVLPLGDEHRLFLFTSGSSGAPVLIEKRLRQLVAEIATLEAQFAGDWPSVRICATVSHQHIYGLLFRLLWPLAAGRAFEVRSQAFLEPIAARAKLEPVVLVSSPAHLKRLPEGLEWVPTDNQLIAVFSSGGPLQTRAAMVCGASFGTTPIEVYGSTESGGIGWRQQRDLDTPFALLPGVAARLDADGVLAVRSPHLSDDAWLALADRAEFEDAGHFRLCGRADRIVKIEEKRISLDAIERAARATAWLDGVRVVLLDGARNALGLVGVPNAVGRELLLEHGRRELAGRLREALLAACERVALPRRFRFVDALPLDAQGKTTEAALRALFGAAEARPLLPFHEWLVREPGRAHLVLVIGPDMHHFRGHFPEQPILPGVAQLDWAIAFGRAAFGIRGRFLRMEALKFQALIVPRQRLDLTLDWDATKSSLSFRLSSVTNAHASARVIFEHV